MSYSEFQHKHNFAVWAAARAAQRGFTSVKLLSDALEESGVMEFAKDPSTVASSDRFDIFHKQWCNRIYDHLCQKGIKKATYGRAAKLIAVYLKVMIVLGDLESKYAEFIHPPIDRILLQNISKTDGFKTEDKKKLRKTNWTQLNFDKYFEIVDLLRQMVDSKPFWMIERYWTVTNQTTKI